MPDIGQFALFLASALLLAVTPGPGLFYVAARALAGGRSEGIASSFGTGLGGMVHILAGSVGVSALVLASAELFTVLKLLGSACARSSPPARMPSRRQLGRLAHLRSACAARFAKA
jgi:threonine/homoserine/homoserine lactone efflux protein